MTKPVLGKTAVYRLYDNAGSLLYVGLGSDPKSRWRAHARDKTWWPDVATKEVEWHDTFSEAASAEHAAIHKENPAHNKASWKWSKQDSQPPEPHVQSIPASLARTSMREVLDAADSGMHTRVTQYQKPVAVFVSPGWYEKAVEALRSTEK